jgi:hypothetical protein
VIVAQKNTFATTRAHDAQKVKSRERGVTNALMIWMMIASLSSSIMTSNMSVAVCASYEICFRASCGQFGGIGDLLLCTLRYVIKSL